jgi:multiple sugar transport system permease protein
VLAGALVVVVFVAPLVWAVLRSFQPAAVITAAPSWSAVTELSWDNYRGLFRDVGISRYVVNSLIVSVATAVLTAVVSTLAGYGFARFRFRGSGLAFSLILVTIMVPFQAIVTPLFLELNLLRLTDSLLGLILFYTTFNLPFGVFVMRNSFAQVPVELEDSAHVDGASPMRILVSVLRPLVLPGIATTVLYAFLTSWTEFLGALTFLTREELYTLPVALVNVQQGAYGTLDYGYLIAGAVISMIPCIVLYVFLQRFYVQGLASGAVKG